MGIWNASVSSFSHRIICTFVHRHFLYCFIAIGIALSCQNKPTESPNLHVQMVEANDQIVKTYLERQNRDTLSSFYGGLPNQYNIYNPGSIAGFMQRLAVAYCQQESEFFHSAEILARLKLGLDFLLAHQHEDGTIDLVTTNFHSTPDLAFAIERIALVHKIFASRNDENLKSILVNTEDFLIKGGEALITGGIHTPNHRWVVCMSLARLFELFPDERYQNRIEDWLSEDIDMDGDGQYNERSTAVYSPLSDRCLITIAKIMNKPELLDYVRKNLDMTLYLLHPNGDIVTEISRRQDQYLARKPAQYHYPYRFMAHQDQNAIYMSMVDHLEQNLTASSLSNSLIYLMEDSLPLQGISTESIPTSYRRFFAANDLVRLRNDQIDVSILARNSTVATFRKNHAVLQAIRMASAFFGKAQFIADTIFEIEDTIVLQQQLEGPYFQPFENEQVSVDSWEETREKRPTSEVQYLLQELQIFQQRNGTMFNWTVTGTDHVPLAIELSFRKGGDLSGVEQIDGLDNSFLMTDSVGRYHYEDSSIEFGPMQHDHQWVQIRGAEPKIDGLSVFLTGYTPFEYTMFLR